MGAPDIGLANWFARRAARTPHRKAVTFEGETLDYAAMQRAIERTAGRLAGLGVVSGDRVAYLGLNHPAFLIAMFACARIGAIFTPLNFRLAGPEIAYIINDSEACVLICDQNLRAVADGVRASLSSVRAFLAVEGDAPGWEAFEGHGQPVEQITVDPDAPALIMYTSGTTGHPKGAILTHANFWWNNCNAIHNVDALADDVTLTAAPCFISADSMC